ncbi:TIGR03619 family F420-dependent LLM class oxidoreductase [Carbonactinospora thermoautotrophica]|uniref:TIGR03619 family F420-dependent LLM class oxidoreductase n=1 Tax=Carbonactinospora thermoautotrophica TaxID=1469144 RepID=UPI000832AB72|nr:TIGR03619 family F420-dependent LLM class oxidoreductase [Carbonactinospora thermoautotrophica]MCX9192395.1 TIGR03619 family F420-dependent LLM class oxidoreductase [Carbonactinospora thermoautotrophica]
MPRLGCKLPTTGQAPLSPGLVTMAGVAEQAGVDAVHVSDHVVLIDGATSAYPFSPDGAFPWPADTDWYDAFVCCAWIAAATERIEVGPSVLVLPQRHPLEVAKVTASIDRLSGGRMFLGVGAGWLAEEFEALGWEFATRIPRMKEAIEVLRLAWAGTGEAYRGEHYEVPAGTQCRPLPVQRGGVPVLLGGMSRAALRRAATYGDGWIALARVDDLDLDRLRGHIETLRRLREELGRDGAFRTVVRLVSYGEVDLRRLPGLSVELAEAGFDEVVVDPGWRDLDAAGAVLSACRRALGAGR